jgi:hypothetical protein
MAVANGFGIAAARDLLTKQSIVWIEAGDMKGKREESAWIGNRAVGTPGR